MTSIGYTRDGHVATVLLNRPQSLNAIDREMEERLAAIWAEANADPDIWVVVLRAAGARAFCAGADIKGGEGHGAGRMAVGGGLTGVGGPLITLTKPLVAAVQGYVLGAGFELAMCADIIVAADTAQFGLPETKAGIIGECGVMHRAIRQLPHRVAMAMILTGERLPAEAAAQYGLVNTVVPFDKLEEATRTWVDRVLAASPLAVQAAKHAAMLGLAGSLETALGRRYEPIEAYAHSADVREGAAAMGEKRKPQWSGR